MDNRYAKKVGLSCEGTKEGKGVKMRLTIITAQYVNIVFDMLIYS